MCHMDMGPQVSQARQQWSGARPADNRKTGYNIFLSIFIFPSPHPTIMGNCFCNKGLKKTVSWLFLVATRAMHHKRTIAGP